MKRNLVMMMSLLTIFILMMGCKSEDVRTVPEKEYPVKSTEVRTLPKGGKPVESAEELGKTEQDINKQFELNLYSDNQIYKTTDKIKIWATLKYIGSNNQIKIWHSNPYISFSITDGKEFDTGNLFDDVLTSTILEKDKLYKFDYVKSGGYSEDDAKADFWRKFYSEKDLYLPEGEYKVTVGGAFSYMEDTQKSKSNLSKELKIKVIKP
ncbi:hypothetical protein [Acetivibrio cellulolyticus]|uniref:hypothetical protein n=1 Tax=Acetivibrio cellulolyticus TaxID=35830 RepID=UPI0001E2D157|nr:hypothetical protein [Acetivibrio cellulolyticus]